MHSPAPAVQHRPRNDLRSLFHALGGLGVLPLIVMIGVGTDLRAIAATAAAGMWSMELLRARFPAFNQNFLRTAGAVTHAHEAHTITSSTWYVSSLMIITLFADLRACLMAVAVLALADPAAGYIGRRHGRHRLASGRSVEGALAFLVTGFVTCSAIVAWTDPHAPWGARLLTALVAATAGMITELWSPVDDNLSIPVVVAAAGMLGTVVL